MVSLARDPPSGAAVAQVPAALRMLGEGTARHCKARAVLLLPDAELPVWDALLRAVVLGLAGALSVGTLDLVVVFVAAEPGAQSTLHPQLHVRRTAPFSARS
jgi:hypothetical protein